MFSNNTNHEENQPAHLTLKNPTVATRINLPEYAGPKQRYCLARVYEYMADEVQPGTGKERLQISAQNCVHCKICGIKDTSRTIDL